MQLYERLSFQARQPNACNDSLKVGFIFPYVMGSEHLDRALGAHVQDFRDRP